MPDPISQQTGLDAAAQAGGLRTGTDLYSIVSYGIRVLLGVLGIIFFILILIGGFQWMTSGGDESKIQAAKHRIASATVGLAVILASYAIALFVLRTLDYGTGGAWLHTPQPGGDLGDYPLPPA